MERMLVTQALDERDLLKKRIADTIARSRFVSSQKPNSSRLSNSNVSVEDFKSSAVSAMQKVKDLIDRYERLDTAILLSNATEKITVAGKEMTRASAINLRKTIIDECGTDTDFRGMLIQKLTSDLSSARSQIAKTQQLAERQRENMTNGLAVNDKKELNKESLESIDSYVTNLIDLLVDPVDVEKKLADLNDERAELIANLETAIKISNATTYVEF